MEIKSKYSIPTLNLLWSLDDVDRGKQDFHVKTRYGMISRPEFFKVKDGEIKLTEYGKEFLETARKWLAPVFTCNRVPSKGAGQIEPTIQEVRNDERRPSTDETSDEF